MATQYIRLKEINGPLVIIDDVEGVAFDEMVKIVVGDKGNDVRLARVVAIEGKRAVLQLSLIHI